MVQPSHLYRTTEKTIALTIWTFVRKVMSLLFSMLSRFVITFLPRSKLLYYILMSEKFLGFFWCFSTSSSFSLFYNFKEIGAILCHEISILYLEKAYMHFCLLPFALLFWVGKKSNVRILKNWYFKIFSWILKFIISERYF